MRKDTILRKQVTRPKSTVIISASPWAYRGTLLPHEEIYLKWVDKFLAVARRYGLVYKWSITLPRQKKVPTKSR